ncbi:unnamed protein product [Rhizophagus irregularis]|nr:unnamed protein product [Rhizophagus irregularis]CAB4403428.1 unnamed protein product [Rhizophagus irregularis]
MNSQQNSLQHKKIIVLLLMQEVFKKKNRVFNANTHLLTFIQVTSNAAFPYYFTHLNLRASQQKRPKTEGFRVDVFPYLTDESGHNSFRKQFRITHATFNAIVARLDSHPGFA